MKNRISLILITTFLFAWVGLIDPRPVQAMTLSIPTTVTVGQQFYIALTSDPNGGTYDIAQIAFTVSPGLTINSYSPPGAGYTPAATCGNSQYVDGDQVCVDITKNSGSYGVGESLGLIALTATTSGTLTIDADATNGYFDGVTFDDHSALSGSTDATGGGGSTPPPSSLPSAGLEDMKFVQVGQIFILVGIIVALVVLILEQFGIYILRPGVYKRHKRAIS